MATTVNIQSQDTTFTRYGATSQAMQHGATKDSKAPDGYPVLNTGLPTLLEITKPSFSPRSRVGPSDLSSLVGGVIGQTDLSSIVSPRVGLDLLTALPTARVGLDELSTIIAEDPLSTTFETETTDLYNRIFDIGYAKIQSGPTNVRGGTARTAYALAEYSTQQSINRYKEIWLNQVQWAGVVERAVELYNAILVQYDSEIISIQQLYNTILTEYDREVMQGTELSNTIARAREQNLIRATEVSNSILADLDKENLSDNEQNIMAQHADALSANQYYEQINAANMTAVQAFAAGRHFGSVQMATAESFNGHGVQGGTVSGFGMSSWR